MRTDRAALHVLINEKSVKVARQQITSAVDGALNDGTRLSDYGLRKVDVGVNASLASQKVEKSRTIQHFAVSFAERGAACSKSYENRKSVFRL